MSTLPAVSEEIWSDDEHRVVWFGRHPPDQERGIPSNQFLVVDGGKGYLIDPGGYHVFDTVFDSVSEYLRPDDIEVIFASHQDPDICAGLVSWLESIPRAELIISELWHRFITHLALPINPRLRPLPDAGEALTLPSGSKLRFVPAHFLHSAGNFQVYDERSKILLSGDLGAAKTEQSTPTFVRDFTAHTQEMEAFHRRYMACNRAVELYLRRVSALDIDMVCPQHGPFMKGDDVQKFFAWLKGLDVGVDYAPWGDA